MQPRTRSSRSFTTSRASLLCYSLTVYFLIPNIVILQGKYATYNGGRDLESLKDFVHEGYKSASFTNCPSLPSWYETFIQVPLLMCIECVGSVAASGPSPWRRSVCNVLRIDGLWNGHRYCGHACDSLLLLRIDRLRLFNDRESRATSLWATRKRTIRVFVKKQSTFPSLARGMRISLSIR